MPCHVIVYHYVILCYCISLCHVMSCHVTPHNFMPWHVMSHHIMLHNFISCRVISYHVMSCHCMSCYVILHHACSMAYFRLSNKQQRHVLAMRPHHLRACQCAVTRRGMTINRHLYICHTQTHKG